MDTARVFEFCVRKRDVFFRFLPLEIRILIFAKLSTAGGISVSKELQKWGSEPDFLVSPPPFLGLPIYSSARFASVDCTVCLFYPQKGAPCIIIIKRRRQ